MPTGIEAELKAGEKEIQNLLFVAQPSSVCNCATYLSIVPTSCGGGDRDYPPSRRVGSHPRLIFSTDILCFHFKFPARRHRQD